MYLRPHYYTYKQVRLFLYHDGATAPSKIGRGEFLCTRIEYLCIYCHENKPNILTNCFLKRHKSLIFWLPQTSTGVDPAAGGFPSSQTPIATFAIYVRFCLLLVKSLVN